MKEIKLLVHLNTWYIMPQLFVDMRKIKLHILCFTFDMLKNKPKR